MFDKRPGPRSRGPYTDKRRTLSTRITDETRAKLDDASKASGRSLSQEIELRLERSFWTDDLGRLQRRIENLENVVMQMGPPDLPMVNGASLEGDLN